MCERPADGPLALLLEVFLQLTAILRGVLLLHERINPFDEKCHAEEGGEIRDSTFTKNQGLDINDGTIAFVMPRVAFHNG